MPRHFWPGLRIAGIGAALSFTPQARLGGAYFGGVIGLDCPVKRALPEIHGIVGLNARPKQSGWRSSVPDC